MGRLLKVLPNDVLTILRRERHVTRKDVALELGCTVATVSRKVAVLIGDGEDVGYDSGGLFIQEKRDIDGNPVEQDRARKYLDRIFNSLKAWAQRGNCHKAVAIEARRRMAKELTTKERSTLRGELLLVTRVIDAISLDEELAE